MPLVKPPFMGNKWGIKLHPDKMRVCPIDGVIFKSSWDKYRKKYKSYCSISCNGQQGKKNFIRFVKTLFK